MAGWSFEEQNGSTKYYCPTDPFYYMVYFISIYLKTSREKRD